MRIDGGGRKVVGQRAEYEVCLVGGVAGGVGRVHVSGVGLGVCVGVWVGVRHGERQFGTRAAAPSDRVCGLNVVEGALGVLGMLGERRKRGRTAHHHAAVTTRKPRLGELGEMGQLQVLGVGGAKHWPTGQRASLDGVRGEALQRGLQRLHVEAMVMVVRRRRLHAARVTELSMQGLDLGRTPVHLTQR